MKKYPYKLGRVENHDSRSKRFAFNTTNIEIKDVEHKRLIPIFNQENVGCCVACSALGAINSKPFKQPQYPVFQPTIDGAHALYSACLMIDKVGTYPPHDVGTSGLSAAKALSNVGMIKGYQHNFTLQDTLKALTQYPLIVGTKWYTGMFTPDKDGRVRISGSLVRGHEYQAYKIDTKNGRVWFHNSWGTDWGINGDFYLTWEDLATLLNRTGDSTVLFAPTDTIPEPMPKPKNENHVIITRSKASPYETIGHLVANNTKGETFACKTLELLWRDNQHNISCIPTGEYKCKIGSFKGTQQYEVLNVPNRTGVFFHPGNFAAGKQIDSEGCILLGDSVGDINGDNIPDILNSKKTVDKFKKFFNSEPFTMTIVNGVDEISVDKVVKSKSMKTVKVKVANNFSATNTSLSEVVSVPVKSWYEKINSWLYILTTLAGVVGVIQQYFPQVSWLVAIGSILSLVISNLEKVISNDALVD